MLTRLYFIFSGTVSTAVFAIPMILLWFWLFSKDTAWRTWVVYLLFGCYFAAVLAATGVPLIGEFMVDFTVNPIPFYGMSPDESLLNVVLFIPMGFFLPILAERFDKPKNTVLTGFAISLFIEIVQIFTFRTSDINDLLTNTAGTIIGYLILKGMNRLAGGNLLRAELEHSLKNVFAVAVIVFAAMFSLSQVFSDLFYQLYEQINI